MKVPSRRTVYGIVTLISAILGLPGLVIPVWAFFDEQEEQESERQRLERESIEKAKKAEAYALHGQITRARAFLENCTMTEDNRTNISLTLDRAEKELTLNDNSTGSRALYKSIIKDVIDCEQEIPPGRTGDTNSSIDGSPLPPVLEVPPPELAIETQVLQPSIVRFILMPLFALISAGVFGFLWYRTSKRQSRERPSG